MENKSFSDGCVLGLTGFCFYRIQIKMKQGQICKLPGIVNKLNGYKVVDLVDLLELLDS